MNPLPGKSPLFRAAAFAAGLAAVLSSAPARAANDAFSNIPLSSGGVANFSNNFSLGTTGPIAAGGQTPASGDLLYFSASTVATLNDDLSGYTFNGLNFTSGAAAFTIGGQAFTLGGSITNASSSLETIDDAIVLPFYYSGLLNAQYGGITIGGNLTGSEIATVTVQGAGLTTLGGANNSITLEDSTSSYFLVAGNGSLAITGAAVVNAGGSPGSFFAVDSQGTLSIPANGMLSFSGGGSGFYIGYYSSGNAATVNVSGALYLGANGPLQIVAFGNFGSTQGTLNINSGGVVTLNSAALLGSQGATAATINLNAGGALASNSAISGAGGVSNFNFNGGTLQALAAQTNWLNGLSAVTTSSSGSTIDANNQAVTISAVITDGASPGGLTITDSSSAKGGVVTLSGANTYSGATAVTGGTLRLQGPAVFPNSLQVMPLGDSITYGSVSSNAGYRGPLYNYVKSLVPNFLYVGSSVQNYAISSDPTIALPQSEWHNEGHPSYRINDIDNNLDGYDPTIYNEYGEASRNPNGGYWFTGISNTSDPNYRLPCYPDLITLMIGINDAGTGVSPTQAQTNLDNLLMKITNERPNAKVIVAQIIPNTASTTPAGWVNSYNAAVRSEVSSFQKAGKHVSTVDLNTGFPAGGLSGDGTHPNDTGVAFMAQQWYGAFVAAEQEGYGPATAIPANSKVILGPGGTLDLGSSPAASAGPLSGSGKVTLGSGILTVTNASGQNSTFSGAISGAGGLTKAGAGTLTLAGAENYSGPTEVSAGVLNVTGALAGAGTIDVANGATLNLAGGSVTASTVTVESGGALTGNGTISGTVVNNGTISGSAAGQTLSFTGSLTNTGTIFVTGGAGFQLSGTLTNSGTVDLLTSSSILPATIIEQGGTAFDSRSLKVSAVTLANGSASVTLPAFTGHTFQLQRSAALVSASWQNVGSSQTGATGTVLTFSDGSPPSNQGFYRVQATP